MTRPRRKSQTGARKRAGSRAALCVWSLCTKRKR